MRRRNLAIGCAVALSILGLFATVLPLGARVSSNTILLRAANLGIYSDSACTQALTSVDWGMVSPGGSVCKTIYVKNLGSYRQRLSLLTANWNPTTAEETIAVRWNMEGARVAARQVVAANLTLTASSSASGLATFSVDLVITGTGYGRQV